MRSACIGCGSEQLLPIDSYKHTWHACNSCGTVRRERKSRYLASHIPGVSALVQHPARRRLLFPAEEVHERESSYYDYYEDSVRAGVHGTKWEGQVEVLRAELAALGCSLDAPAVLDVSGGPGFFAKELADRGSTAVVTEYSPRAAAAMHRVLGIPACEYDCNRHSFANVLPPTPAKYDVVLMRYALNFCSDLSRFAADVATILRPGGIFYVSYVQSTLGPMMRWGHDEYTYNALYQPDFVRRRFGDAGLVHVGEIPAKHKDYGWIEGLRPLFLSMLLPYGAKALANVSLRKLRGRLQPGFHDFTHVHCEEVYRLPASS